jgi:hypothetical protein
MAKVLSPWKQSRGRTWLLYRALNNTINISLWTNHEG